jgi:hypothetical protein
MSTDSGMTASLAWAADALALAWAGGARERGLGEYRSLSPAEVELLERNCNSSADWACVHAPRDAKGLDRIRDCYFGGEIVLGHFIGEVSIGNNLSLPSGLRNSNFSGKVYLQDNCLVQNTTMVCNVVLGRKSCILSCGVVMNDNEISTFGNGAKVALGPESNGGRSIPMFIGAGYGSVCRAALDRTDALFQDTLSGRCRQVVERFSQPISIIGDGAILSRNDLIKNVLLGPHCVISSSTVECCTVLSTEDDPTHISGGGAVHTCILSGSNTVSGPCQVSNCLLFDNASIFAGASVSHCVLAPDRFLLCYDVNIYFCILYSLLFMFTSSVAGAECLHALIGPFIGIHHSSLVISCSWPCGRGNVAYGAKVGANHTGRVNDQECLSGEGVFYGLGVQIKFPFNTLGAPYSLFAGKRRAIIALLHILFVNLFLPYSSGHLVSAPEHHLSIQPRVQSRHPAPAPRLLFFRCSFCVSRPQRYQAWLDAIFFPVYISPVCLSSC